MLNKHFILILISLSILLVPILSQSKEEECGCDETFCSSISSSSLVLKGEVKRSNSKKNGITIYKVKVSETFKGKAKRKVNLMAPSNDSCSPTLKEKNDYLFVINEKGKDLWISSCYTQKWSSLSDKDMNTLEECSTDTSLCPDGSHPFYCFVQPCSLKETQCPQAEKCFDDYCGGCKAHYFDKKGNEICQNCPEIICERYCEFGNVLDENGCKTCDCNEQPTCSDGSLPVDCAKDPCDEQREKCPEASRCVSDYCGGCNAHFFDRQGNEICGYDCPEITCERYCEFGNVLDEDGCRTCDCNEQPICSDGSVPVECAVNPCDEQREKCPEASRCVPDYCGGCNAHFYDKEGNVLEC